MEDLGRVVVDEAVVDQEEATVVVAQVEGMDLAAVAEWAARVEAMVAVDVVALAVAGMVAVVRATEELYLGGNDGFDRQQRSLRYAN
ncbi:hypothetical protein SUGI_0305080 [Cryptomeria japonica]|nr:hypothetical protein SUGI_0305080 [Cryptomeria japonica]